MAGDSEDPQAGAAFRITPAGPFDLARRSSLHRISIKQAHATRARLAVELGSEIPVVSQSFHAFPTPTQLLAAGILQGRRAVARLGS